MSNLFFKAEGFSSSRTLPTLSDVQDIISIPTLEADAYGHWEFGGDQSSLIDKVNARSLTLQAGATVQPEYGENYVRLGAAKGQSLQSGLLDSAVTDYTVSGVVMPEDVVLMVLLGNLGSNDVGLGAGLFTSANKVYVTARTGVSSVDPGLALDMSKPAFISMSVNKTTGVVNIVAMQNGATFENTATGAQVEAAAPISVGNSRYTTGGAYNTLKNKYYEAVIHSRALSISEMKAIANRAKVRLAARGITF